MALLHFKGRRAPIEIPEKTAKSLQDDWLEGKLPKRITLTTVDGTEESFVSEDVRGIQAQKQLEKRKLTSQKFDSHMEWLTELEEMKKESKEAKAKRNVNTIVSTAFKCAGKELTEEIEEEIYTDLVSFFESNSKRVFLDFDKHVLPRIKSLSDWRTTYDTRILELIAFMCVQDANR